MNIFNKIWNWIKNLLIAIWEWLKEFLNPDNPVKKPIVRITVLTILISFMIYPKMSFAQRNGIETIYIYFEQSSISLNDQWTIRWSDGTTDSVTINKSDTNLVKMKNDQGEWVNWNEIPPENELVSVRIKINNFYVFNTEFTFNVIALNSTEQTKSISIPVIEYFIKSDINKVSDPDITNGYNRGDHTVDGLDLIEFSRYWARTGLGQFDYYDLNGDGNTDGLDLIQFSKEWGKTWIP